jgi:hypothetical protein
MAKPDRHMLRWLHKPLKAYTSKPRVDQAAVDGMPPIEQITYDLHRLDRQRRTGPTKESERWMSAVRHAYDVRLSLACQVVDVSEHLLSLAGVERDVERVRIEVELRDAGYDIPRPVETTMEVGETAGCIDGFESGPEEVRQRQSAQNTGRLINTVALILPGRYRARYVEEFHSELYELALNGASRRQQLWYALRLFDRAWVLSAELREAALRRARP